MSQPRSLECRPGAAPPERLPEGCLNGHPKALAQRRALGAGQRQSKAPPPKPTWRRPRPAPPRCRLQPAGRSGIAESEQSGGRAG